MGGAVQREGERKSDLLILLFFFCVRSANLQSHVAENL